MNLPYPLILGSKSPRRKEILEKAGFSFATESLDTPEDYPEELPKKEVAAYLAVRKARAFLNTKTYENSIILTADTTVLIDNLLIEKPTDFDDAKRMLNILSDRTHEVISAFAILYKNEILSFSDSTLVSFSRLSEAEIERYIKRHKPYDKAGAYGIQEGLGLTHIHKLQGSYFTVMGLPIHKVYQQLSILSA